MYLPGNMIKPLAISCLWLWLCSYTITGIAEPEPHYRALEKITVQLRYKHQFQFAGFYAAIDQGYYRDVGLDVTLREASLQTNVTDELLLGKAHYGQTQADLLYYRLQGKPLVALAPIFQHSPSVLLVRANSGIHSPHDLKGKRVMLELGDNAISIVAMLNQEGIKLSMLQSIEQSYSVEELINGQVDAVGVYLTNRPFLLQQQGIAYHILNPLSYGMDFYGDTLFTTEAEVREHPQRVVRFLQATLKGWKYALAHPEAIIDLLVEQYGVTKSRAHLQFEAEKIHQLVIPELIEIGHNNPARWQRMREILIAQGMATDDSSLQGFFYQPLKPWYQRLPNEYLYSGLGLALLALLGLLYYWRLSRSLREQILARQTAESDNQRLGDVLEHSLNEIYIFDAETLHFIQVNEGARNNLGYTLAELKQLTPLDIKPEYSPEKFDYLTGLLKKGLGQVVFETLHQRKDGSLYPVSVNLQLHKGVEGSVFYAVINDISERKSSDAKIKRLSYLYEMLSEINQAIATINKEAELFESICRITIEFGHFGLVWIGIRNDEHRIVPIAYAGQNWDYLQNLLVSVDADLPEGQGPSGRAYRSGEIQVCNSFMHDDTTLPWQEKARKCHWASSCAIPILRGSKAYAVLNLYSSEVDYFEHEIIKLFEQMQGDLSFALDAFDRELDRRRAQDDLVLAAKVFQQSHDAILISDCDNNIISVNQAFTALTGYSEKQVLGKNPRLLSSGRYNRDFYADMWHQINQESYWQGEIWNRHAKGELQLEWLTISVVKDLNEKISHFIGIFSDITQRKESEQRKEYLAHFDALTDLPNRVLLKIRHEREVAVAERKGRPFALLYMDLDYFKEINDSLSHAVGDQLLVETAARLKMVLRNEDTIARLGGDEFNILLPETDYSGASLVAGKIIKAISQPVHIEQLELNITTSIGISLYPENGKDYDTLAANADTALYQAKQLGKNQYVFFTQAMQQKAKRRMALERDLRKALENNELEMVYQPIVKVDTGVVSGVEALMRWQHPVWGMVSPTEFISVAEDSGLISTISQWGMKQSIAQAAKWQHQARKPIHIAINLSIAQFKKDLLLKSVTDLLNQFNFNPEYLELEITEAMVMKNAKAATAITRQLNQLGVKFSLDNFGTGYSSLSHLQQFDLYRLKIDRSFIQNLELEPSNNRVVDSMINLAHNLGLKATAEGVENEQQLHILQQQQCDEIQGYLFSKPVSATEFDTLLAKGQLIPQEEA
jgi:diguanylate cyclase (GGDEF)-like protein/PAS domain S-box-containing protein